MKKYLLTLVALAVAALAGSTLLAAARPIVIADVPNAFTVAKQSLPAGKYTITLEDESTGMLGIRNDATGKKVMVESLTRLAMRNNDQAELVFDKVGDSLFLSEIHLTDEDGFFLPGAPSLHTHVRLKAGKKS
jgi:hypothetical protein